MQAIHLEPSQVPQALKGNYSGRAFQAFVCETVSIPADAGLWSGGSRTEYFAVDLSTGERAPVSFAQSAPWDKDRRNESVTLEPGKAVVAHVMFQGKDLGLRFYVHPQNAVALIPAKAEMSNLERYVLLATRRFKSSYGGRDRFQMAADDYDCKQLLQGESLPDRSEWNAAKTALVVDGYLNKAGAITVKGRNAT